MRPAGLAAVEAAQADGRWERAYAGAKDITVPDDLAAALDADPAVRAEFESLDGANRYAVLCRVHTAATPATRAKRIAAPRADAGRGPPHPLIGGRRRAVSRQ